MTDEHGRPRRGLSAFVHSAKPERLYTEIIPSLYPGPRVEMFSRRSRAGWSTAHSNQDGKMDQVAKIMRDVVIALMPAQWLRFDAFQRLDPHHWRVEEFNAGVTLTDAQFWTARFGMQFLRDQLEEYTLDVAVRLAGDRVVHLEDDL